MFRLFDQCRGNGEPASVIAAAIPLEIVVWWPSIRTLSVFAGLAGKDTGEQTSRAFLLPRAPKTERLPNDPIND